MVPDRSKSTTSPTTPPDWSDPKLPAVGYKIRHQCWVPTPEELRGFGVPPKRGFWPVTVRDVQGITDHISIDPGSVLFISQRGQVSQVSDWRALPLCAD